MWLPMWPMARQQPRRWRFDLQTARVSRRGKGCKRYSTDTLCSLSDANEFKKAFEDAQKKNESAKGGAVGEDEAPPTTGGATDDAAAPAEEAKKAEESSAADKKVDETAATKE